MQNYKIIIIIPMFLNVTLTMNSIPLSFMAIFRCFIKILSLGTSRETHNITQPGYFEFYSHRKPCLNTDSTVISVVLLSPTIYNHCMLIGGFGPVINL